MIILIVLIISVFTLFIAAIPLLSIKNAKDTRQTLLFNHLVPENVSSTSLSHQQLTMLRKIYGKTFKDGNVYKIKGHFCQGQKSAFFSGDPLTINGIKIKTGYRPYQPIILSQCNEFNEEHVNYSEILLKAEDKKEVDAEGVVYKDCLYITKMNDFDVVAELTETFSKKPHIGAIYMGAEFALLPGMSWFFTGFFVVLNATSASVFAIPLIVVFLILILFFVYTGTRNFSVEGIFYALPDRYNKPVDSYRNGTVGMIDGVFIETQHPLEVGQHYTMLLSLDPMMQTHFLSVEKVNGVKYTRDEDCWPELILVVMFVGFILSAMFLFHAKSHHQAAAKPYYEHNEDKFGDSKISQYVRKTEDLKNTEVGDLLQVRDLYYSHVNQHFVLFDEDTRHNKYNYSEVYSAFRLYCKSGKITKAVNAIDKKAKIRRTVFMLNGMGREDYTYATSTRPAYDSSICESKDNLVRYIACHDCQSVKMEDRQLVVTDIDKHKGIIHVTDKFDVFYYAIDADHYLIAIVNMFVSVVYLLIGIMFVLMKYKIRKINDSPDILWVK
ncbi:hypothetical protein L4C36_12280 [Photobacterium japonica]|uniref:hypothetical protein n=1 Tax=Photobacterium japonica TaxID=2910235 RepID=UPI003D0EA8F2